MSEPASRDGEAQQLEWDIEVSTSARGPVVLFDFAGPVFRVDKAVEIRGYTPIDGYKTRLLTSHEGPIVAHDNPEPHLRVPLDHSVLRLDVPEQCYVELLNAVEEHVQAET